MNKEMDESQKRLRSLLRQLFQFDFSDLDHGIYRIMNQRREEIEKFIDKDLFQKTDEAFQEYLGTSAESLQKEVEELKSEINASFGAGTIDEHGEIKSYHDTPKVRKYAEKQEELRSAKLTRGQIEDVYNHVYEFFSRYFDKGDFISKGRYGGKDKYVIPYNGEEVMLHWANKDQYYVKTTEYFNNLEFKAGEWKVEFILTQAELEQNNVKGDNRYFVLADEEKISLDETEKKLTIYFQYRALNEEERKELGKGDIQKTIIEKIEKKILSKVKDKGIEKHLTKKEEDKTLLAKQLNMYVDKNTSDYFIHKKLREFLQRELDFYIKNEVLHLDEIVGKGKDLVDERKFRLNIARIKAIRDISGSIIDFLAQIEDFQKMLFKKKKLVLRADYCMTLDKVPEEFYEEIVDNEAQIEEWKELFDLEEFEKQTNPLGFSSDRGLNINQGYLKSHPYLVLDTKFFSQDFKDRLLASFEDLDEEISGLLVKSENWQALNLLQKKYRRKVKCCYIDPPYNTEGDRRTGKFLYKDNFEDSSWLSLLNDRIGLAEKLMDINGALFCSIDDNEQHLLKSMLENYFNSIRVLPVVSNLKGNQDEYGFAGTHEYLISCTFEDGAEGVYLPLNIDEEEMENWEKDKDGYYKKGANLKSTGTNAPREKRPNLYFPIFVTPKNEFYVTDDDQIPSERIDSGDITIFPITSGQEMSWRWSKKKIRIQHYDIIIERNGNNISIYKKQRPALGDMPTKKPKSIFYKPKYSSGNGTAEIKNIFSRRLDITPKPLGLIKDIVEIGAGDNTIILDLFAGSGTTGHAVLLLNKEYGYNRNYILMEMGGYFDEILKPRIEKIMFSKEWENGNPVSTLGISHMFKYMYLEQYEDTLYNIAFRAKDKTFQETLETFDDYFVRYMLEYETRESATRLATADFENPFDYKIKKVSGSGWEIEPVDLVETFNYLLGLDVEQIKTAKDGERYYRYVKGRKQNGNTTVIVWRSTKGIDLKKDKEFIEEKFLSEETPEQIYVNGMCHVANAKPIETEFKRLMGA